MFFFQMTENLFGDQTATDWPIVACLSMTDLVMIWACIIVDYKTVFALYCLRFRGLKYQDDILHQIIRPTAGNVREDFIFINDNARPNRTRIVNEYLES